MQGTAGDVTGICDNNTKRTTSYQDPGLHQYTRVHTLMLSDAPPRTTVVPPWDVCMHACSICTRDHAPSMSGSFMIIRRKRWNCLASFMGLVKMSAKLSTVRTKGTSSSKDSTMSRTKKCRRCTCFILS